MEGHERCAIDEDAIPAAGEQDRHHYFHILLVEILVLAPKVEHPFFVGAKAIKRLAFGPFELELGVVGLAIDDLSDIDGVHPHTVGVLVALDRRRLVEDGDEHIHWVERLAAPCWLPREHAPRRVPVREGEGLLVDLDGEGIGRQDERLGQLLHTEGHPRRTGRRRHHGKTRLAAQLILECVANTDGAGRPRL